MKGEMMDADTEVILGIEEIEENGKWDSRGGYLVTTNKQEIKFLIDMSPSCCESFGYFISEDDPERFIGENLLGVEVTDTNRNESVAFKSGGDYSDEEGKETIHLDSGDVLFVDIRTSRGIFQLAAYNSHNGYYGHTASIVSKQVSEDKTL